MVKEKEKRKKSSAERRGGGNMRSREGELSRNITAPDRKRVGYVKRGGKKKTPILDVWRGEEKSNLKEKRGNTFHAYPGIALEPVGYTFRG